VATGGDARPEAATRTVGKDPRLRAMERQFFARLFSPPPGAAPEQMAAWYESPVSELLYPPDHACAGQPLDGISPAALETAASEQLWKLLENLPDLDREQCHITGNWPFADFHRAFKRVNRDDPHTIATFIEELSEIPQDPDAYPANVWLPCPGHPDATTMRAYYSGVLGAYVQEMFSGPPCPVP
jgi:hypothetical protein